MDLKIETKNQRIIAEYLQEGYELITIKEVKGSNTYLLGKEIDDELKLVVINNGKVSYQPTMPNDEDKIKRAFEMIQDMAKKQEDK